MRRTRSAAHAFVLSLLAVVQAGAQFAPETTRFTITGAPILTQPKGEFGRNIGNSFGAEGGFLYHLDRPGFVSLRLDLSGVEYGKETRRVPFSETVGQRVLVDVTTANSITTLGFGPELAWPRGPVRPYVLGGISEMWFRTTSSVRGVNYEDEVASTTNYSDRLAAWVAGGGIRIPLLGSDPRRALSLDAGVRYYAGGIVSYLREGSIQELPGGSITINPLSSSTPHLVYQIGVRYRIPHDPASPCRRFLC